MSVLEFLKTKVELFEDFSERDLKELIDGSEVVFFEQNEAAIEFGEQGRFLGVLIEGEAYVSTTDGAGKSHVIATLTPGEIFGEISLMTGNNSIADVIGRTRVKALVIPQSLFSSVLVANPLAINYISRLISSRLARYGKPATGEANAEEFLMRKADPFGFRLRTAKPQAILVINCGSSSLKYRFFDTSNEDDDFRGAIEKIGSERAVHTWIEEGGKKSAELGRLTHKEAFDAMSSVLSEVLARKGKEITLVGHRVVHGGNVFEGSVIIDEAVISAIESLSPLAPLHNPINLIGIREAANHFPNVPQVAVFDTSFHHTLAPYAYLYGLPYHFFEEDNIRRYGFHGMSHSYVSRKAAEFLKRPFNSLEIVSCHLGNGASVCAVDHGRSVDTSMGFTPLDGLVMGTRSGSVDPGALIHIARSRNLSVNELDSLLNESSGLLGISGYTNDMREIETKAAEGDSRSILAVKTFAYQVKKHIGAYAAAMAGLDVLVFAGGIGEKSVYVRSLACQGLGFFGLILDEAKNRNVDPDADVVEISAINSQIKVLVVRTDEERMVAREALDVMNRNYVTNIINKAKKLAIPVEVSAHHVHLSEEHIAALFGKGYALSVFRDLSQPGQFACNETVNLIGPKGRIEKVRILGPARKATQMEIAMTEQYKLGIQAPVRESGDIAGSPGLTIEGPAGSVTIEQGVICALRHIHMAPEDALSLGLCDKDYVRVRIEGDRELVFGDVLIRVSPQFRLAMHIDTDEGNAGNIKTGATGYIEGIQGRR
jgi:acetate kinase